MSVICGDNLVNEKVKTLINQLAKEHGFHNFLLTISPGTKTGDNYYGIIAKVEVKDKDENTLLNLIVKSAPTNEFLRTNSPVAFAYKREIYIYETVFPAIIKFQSEKNISKPFKSMTKCYKSSIETLSEALIMENMKQFGYELHERQKTFDYNHALLAMKEYGKLHAISFAIKDQNPNLFRELADNLEDNFFNYFQHDTKMTQDLVDRGLNALNSLEYKTVYDKLNSIRDTMFLIVQELLQSKSAGQYAVIRHGDCWINNLLFKYGNPSEPQHPTEVCFLDWQLSHLGSPALDLSYFIFTCTGKELRDQYYDQLLQEYYKSFSSFLCDLGSDPETLFPYQVLEKHLQKFSIFGIYMSMIILILEVGETEEIPDVNTMENVKDLKNQFSFKSKNMKIYDTRIRDNLIDFNRFGYNFH